MLSLAKAWFSAGEGMACFRNSAKAWHSTTIFRGLPVPNEFQTLGNRFDTRAGGKFGLTDCLRTPPAAIGHAAACAPGVLPDDIFLDQDGPRRRHPRHAAAATFASYQVRNVTVTQPYTRPTAHATSSGTAMFV